MAALVAVICVALVVAYVQRRGRPSRIQIVNPDPRPRHPDGGRFHRDPRKVKRVQ